MLGPFRSDDDAICSFCDDLLDDPAHHVEGAVDPAELGFGAVGKAPLLREPVYASGANGVKQREPAAGAVELRLGEVVELDVGLTARSVTI